MQLKIYATCVVLWNSRLVAWKSKVQAVVSVSITTAEFVAIILTLCNMEWSYKIVVGVGLMISSSQAFIDNQRPINVVKREVSTVEPNA